MFFFPLEASRPTGKLAKKKKKTHLVPSLLFPLFPLPSLSSSSHNHTKSLTPLAGAYGIQEAASSRSSGRAPATPRPSPSRWARSRRREPSPRPGAPSRPARGSQGPLWGQGRRLWRGRRGAAGAVEAPRVPRVLGLRISVWMKKEGKK